MKRQPFYWLNDVSRVFLERGYLLKGETAEQRLRDICNTAERISRFKGFGDSFFEHLKLGHISLSTPVWTNFGRSRGMPVSCFNSHVSDNIGSILYAASEIGMMSKLGGGTSTYLGDLRPRGSEITDNGHSTGATSFVPLYDTVTNVISQGSSRRGRVAPYLPIDHGDIDEFLDVATDGHPIQDLNHAVVIPDDWMNSMVGGDKEKRKIWAKLLKRRKEIGFPYILFKDTVNNNKPQVYKDKGYTINSSNLCSEIMLPSKEDESFTCVLSSVNLLHYDEWKDTNLVELMVIFLDAVAEEFTEKLLKYKDSNSKEDNYVWDAMQRTYNFTKRHRALGLGVLGWHSLLQSKMLPFDSKETAKLNLEVFKNIRQQADKATETLAEVLGEPEVLKGYGRRNTTTLAIAPTTSSAAILGQVSQSIEPYMSNYYIKDMAKVKTVIKNPYLEELLEVTGYNTKEVWDTIADHDGSVQSLPDYILSPEEKEVFKTFGEINPEVIIDQAGIRQQYIDQGQSLNLMISDRLNPKEINELHLRAWKVGVKSLYYQHSTNAAQVLLREKNGCKACEA